MESNDFSGGDFLPAGVRGGIKSSRWCSSGPNTCAQWRTMREVTEEGFHDVIELHCVKNLTVHIFCANDPINPAKG